MYKAKCDFHDSRVGRLKEGDTVKDSPAARDLATAGYLVKYKTKIVNQAPERPEKVTKKKKTKKK